MRHESVTSPSEHHVQLFDSSRSLVETVGEFLLAGFGRGAPLLIVATAQHRDLLTRKLESSGLNVHNAQVINRIVMLDAEQTLDKFMRATLPNPIAFNEVVGGLVARLSRGKRVCIYGEMVDVLAAHGNYKAAQLLEELWNDLGRRESFDLFCGYASGHFGDPKTAKALSAICAAHDHLHRKADDLLAEFLLEQPEVKSIRPGTASRS
jgi:hypothetical protein